MTIKRSLRKKNEADIWNKGIDIQKKRKTTHSISVKLYKNNKNDDRGMILCVDVLSFRIIVIIFE